MKLMTDIKCGVWDLATNRRTSYDDDDDVIELFAIEIPREKETLELKRENQSNYDQYNIDLPSFYIQST